MVALVGAMFVAMGSVGAVDGSLTLQLPSSSSADTSNVGTVDAGANYDSAKPASATVATVEYNAGDATATVTAVGAGSTTVTIKDDAATGETAAGTEPDLVYEITVLPFGFKSIKSDDSDDKVKAGTVVTVTVTLNSQEDDSEVQLTVPTTGLSIDTTSGTGQGTVVSTSQAQRVSTSDVDTDDDTADRIATFQINSAGAPNGEYVLTFEADRNGFGEDNAAGVTNPTDKLTLTVGDPGEGLASATLGPNNVKGDPVMPSTDADAAPDKTTKPKDSTIYLIVSGSNSLGNASNPGDVNQVIVFAVGGTIDGSTVKNSKTFSEVTETDGPQIDNVGAKQAFSVTRATPGVVKVTATVIGGAGSFSTNEVELVFTGDAEEISLGDPSDQLGQLNDSITVDVAAADKAGNPASISPLQTTSVKVLDSDGNTAKNISASEAQKMDDKGTKNDTEDDTPISTAVEITVSSSSSTKAAPGNYTLEVKLGSKSTATADFTVVGDPGSIEVAASTTSSDTIGDIITVTATVTDADGNPVTDGIDVNFSVSQMTGLAAIGTNHRNTSPAGEDSNGPMTKDGSASVKYAVVGSGTSVISATASGATGVVVIDSTAGSAEVMADEEASVACLSSLSGFATWACGVESSASEIFGLVSGRGATALHLWNGSAWVRYSVVDGTMVPGSSDFMVAENDILYISN